ncbi:PREDICTED: BURP domain-containing protein 6-like [Nelumbo nucifera]|uniref:BURP domain-containing protein 6-like n=1 Tax=Nelumbo nucifera TaxID=4432 RepID=A0A1U8A3V3_NELNU|nr:PREDICTED: BURP domain-containing protein 6-like [Nelumbo nucifera]
MELCFPNILTSFLLVLAVAVSSDAALPSEIYWKSMLPSTPMPKLVQHQLTSGAFVNSGQLRNLGKMTVVPSSVNINWNKFHKWGSAKKKQGIAGFQNKKQLKNNNVDPKDVDYYFLEENLHPGRKMTLETSELSGDHRGAILLSRQVADSIPFSSNKLPDILHRFSVNDRSIEAEAMKETIMSCERPGDEIEAKRCATSLESMIDFSISKLGKNIKAVTTEFEYGENYNGKKKKQFIISSGIKKMTGNPVVCHGMTYPYAVYYCHVIRSTRSYVVPLVAADGTKAKAIAVCHTDTKDFSPDHIAFKLLNIKPGGVPICHFLPDDTIALFPN